MSSELPRWLDEFHHKDNEVRWAAVEALVALGREAIPGLLEKLHAEKRSTRVLAIKALRRIGDTDAVPGLIGRLADDEQVVVEAAALALFGLGDERSVPALVGLLSVVERPDLSNRVRKAAAIALQRIGTAEALAAVERWQGE